MKKSSDLVIKKKRKVLKDDLKDPVNYKLIQDCLLKLKAGASYDQIADAHWLTRVSVKKVIMGYLRRTMSSNIEHTRRLELARMDDLWTVAYIQAMQGNLKGTSICLQIQKQRAEMLGLEAPKRVEQTITPALVLPPEED